MNRLTLYPDPNNLLPGSETVVIRAESDVSAIESKNRLVITAPDIEIQAGSGDVKSIITILDSIALGPQGPRGVSGPQGERGPTGYPGPTGAAGQRGADGLQGNIGPVGPEGIMGPTGLPGPKGEQGEPGAPGIVGKAGSAGLRGPQGVPGVPGGRGAVGKSGTFLMELTDNQKLDHPTNVGGHMFWSFSKVNLSEELKDTASIYPSGSSLDRVRSLHRSGGLQPWSYFPDCFNVVNNKRYMDNSRMLMHVLHALGEVSERVVQ